MLDAQGTQPLKNDARHFLLQRDSEICANITFFKKDLDYSKHVNALAICTLNLILEINNA